MPGPLPTMIMGLRALVSASTFVKLGFAREEAGRIRVSDEFLRDGQDALEGYLGPDGVLQGELIDVPDLPVRWITVVLGRPANDEVPPDLPVERDFLRCARGELNPHALSGTRT